MPTSSKFTTARMKKVSKRLNGIYKQASEELAEKVNSFFADFERLDKQKAKLVESGKMSESEYKEWRKNKLLMGKKYEDLRDTMAKRMTKADEIATAYMNGELPAIYAHNFNQVGKDAEAIVRGFSFDLVNEDAVRKLSTSDKTLLPYKIVDGRRAERWHTKRVNSAILQGILQGEGSKKIAKRLMETTEMSKASAIRNARTALTGAQNKGRDDAMGRLIKAGLPVRKKWIATTGDSRTRDAHLELHGISLPWGKPFENSIGRIMYPGDPNAHPSNTYNCRCSMITDFSEVLQEQEKSTIVQGSDISETWERRPDQFAFEIDDVINAQGFDGLPEVVDPEEFDQIAKENKFLAQRGYVAPDKETLDAYRDQLYNGKWYVDCSHGAAMYGQGMYAGANFTGEMSEGVKRVSDGYSGNGLGYVETFTMRNANLVPYSDMQSAFNGGMSPKDVERLYSGLTKDESTFLDMNASALFSSRSAPNWKEASEAANRLGEEGRTRVMEKFAQALQESKDRAQKNKGKYKDIGAYAASCGYDGMICGKPDEDGVYVVILNRTKCVFRRPN